jgi:hypothetical protein
MAQDETMEGRTVTRGICPASDAALTEFLEQHGDRGVLRIELATGDDVVVRDLEPPSDRPSARPVFSGTRIDAPVGDRVALGATGITTVEVVPAADRVDLLPGLAATIADRESPPAALLSAMADVADEQPADVAPHIDTVLLLLDAPDEERRCAAARCVSKVAEDRPDAVRDAAVDPTSWLEDDHHLVRVNACWTVGHLADESAVDALEAAAVDDHVDVRGRAQWALGEITR